MDSTLNKSTMSDNLETDIRFVSSRTQFENVESLFGQWFVISNEFRSWFEFQ